MSSLTNRLFVPALAVGAVALAIFSTPAHAVVTPALEYHFNDVSGSTVPNHGSLGSLGQGTLNVGTTVGTGGQPYIRDGAGYLIVDAGGDLMSTVDIDALDALNDFTLSFFVKPTTSLVNWRDMIGDCDPSPANGIKGWNFMNMSGGVGRLRLWHTGGGNMGDLNSASGLMVQDEWHHVALVANHLTESGSRTITVDFYQDGEYFSTATRNDNRQVGNDSFGFKIGNAMWDPELLAQYGGVAFFDRALTAEEVGAYYNYWMTPEPSATVLLLLGLSGVVVVYRRSRRPDQPMR